PERRLVHGTHPAGGTHRQERDHPARFHAAADARGRCAARGRDSRSRTRSAPAHSHDDTVYAVWSLAARARHWSRKRTAAAARPRRHRRAGPVHTDHAVRGAHAARRHPGRRFPPAVTAPGLVWSQKGTTTLFPGASYACAYHTRLVRGV